MKRKKLYKAIEKLQQSFSDQNLNLIYEAIKLFSPIIEDLKDKPDNFLSNDAPGMQRRNTATSQIQKIIVDEKKLEFRKLVVQATKLESEIDKVTLLLQGKYDYYHGFLSNVKNELDNFFSSYEKHTRSYTVSTCLALSISASNLKAALHTTTSILSSFLLLSRVKDIGSESSRLDIYFSNVITLKDYAVKLDSIYEIYKELLSLYGESEHDYPLLLEHLESGSLWIKVAGHALTATLLASLLTAATTYYQNEFTKTGQLKQLPSSVKTLDGLLKISEQLENDGYDTGEIKDNIRSATNKVAKKLDILLGDQPYVEINDIEYNVGDKLSIKLIEQSKTHRIEYTPKDLGV